MQHAILITEEILNSQSDFAESQGLMPELFCRLIIASVRNPTGLRVPFGGSVNQPGLDGLLISPTSFDPYVPQGQSIWEIGTGNDPQSKATSDFTKRTKEIAAADRATMAFVFVTTRSAVHCWSEPKQRAWLKRRVGKGWKDVRIIDGSKVIQWLYHFPEISLWLADKFHIPTRGMTSPALHWKILERFGSPPSLVPTVFLIGRDKAKEDVLRLFRGETTQLLLETRYPQEGIDFIVAVLASLDQAQRDAFASRCLIIDDEDTWKGICSIRNPHVLIAKASIDLGGTGVDLLQHALMNRHAVIYARVPAGSTHGNSTSLGETKPYDLAKALEGCGYPAERARMISDRCGGRIVVMKRLLSDLSASPDWASSGIADELALASLIGQWDGNFEGDREAVEGILGKTYGEWLGRIRPTTLRPDPPLVQRNEKWRFVSRFEGWESLGPYLSNDDLDRFHWHALVVLREKDPKFDLPSEERWKASIYNKKPKYSDAIRVGLAETLALLGAHPSALVSCSVGKPESVAGITVRDLLKGGDWVNWATWNDVLPLLAESAPEQFLDAVESILSNPANRVFHDLFSQEGTGFMGGWNYMTGVLWALETLAWHQDYLTHVAVILGRLAEIDPGGQWANRPLNSLTTILLPWLPQTCAPVLIRKVALEAVLRESPKIAWKVLLNLLPNSYQVTSGSRKPSWREFIPIDRPERVSRKEYFEQVTIYANLAIQGATTDLSKLSEMIDKLDDLPLAAQTEILKHLSSTSVLNLSEQEKSGLWEALLDVVIKHRKFSDAQWAMQKELVDRIADVAEALKPSTPQLIHRRLFRQADFELIEDKGDYQDQWRELGNRRVKAIEDILLASGIEGLLSFATSITDTQQVGLALGQVATDEHDLVIIPPSLLHKDKTLQTLASGYVWARFNKNGWQWADKVILQSWSDEEKSAFLALLPFEPGTWQRAKTLLGDKQVLYWAKADARPYHLKDVLPEAVEHLLAFRRPRAAIQCLYWMVHEKMQISVDQVHRALIDNLTSEEPSYSMDQHACTELIQWLQNNAEPENAALFQIEWSYLPLLDHHHGLAPKTLERRLAEDPHFFCEVIQLVFRSSKEDKPTEEPSEERKRIASNAYDLLHKWRTPPGTMRDGSFKGDVLKTWLETVKGLCEASGHLRIALDQVGRVLAHSPGDGSGLWIHKGAAEILDVAEHDMMRVAFTVELSNQRGVFTWTAGEEERTIAGDYRNKAAAVENEGYFRLAASMRELAGSYERDADREAAEDPYDR
jgi:hypothetical protein